MKFLVYFFILVLSLSCISKKNLSRIKYKFIPSFNKLKEVNYKMNIPKGYELLYLLGENEIAHRYSYKDSSIIYISHGYNLNDNNIKSLGDSIYNKRFECIELNAAIQIEKYGTYTPPDTIVLEGKSDDGLFWKDVRIDFISIGYINVPKERKTEFDNALKSLKRK